MIHPDVYILCKHNIPASRCLEPPNFLEVRVESVKSSAVSGDLFEKRGRNLSGEVLATIPTTGGLVFRVNPQTGRLGKHEL